MGKDVIIACDFASAKDTFNFLDKFTEEKPFVKIGMELFYAEGPEIVREIKRRGHKIFLDLKLHDIPNTVAKACTAAAKLGVWLVNVHALGGTEMMTAAREALEKFQNRPKLIAVTVLTSTNRIGLQTIGIDEEPRTQVLRLAKLAKECGLDGVVSSAQEANVIKQYLGSPFFCVTPGIRPAGAALGDQKRVMTPKEAIENGSDYLVIGRPITQATDPIATLEEINESIKL